MASTLTSTIGPHLLVLIASLPDQPDIARLREAGTQVVIWQLDSDTSPHIGTESGDVLGPMGGRCHPRARVPRWSLHPDIDPEVSAPGEGGAQAQHG